MTFAQILESEDSNRNKIILYREGIFLKAYEHSAFLCFKYIHSFKLSYRFIKSVNRYVISLGFPDATLKKWTYAYPVRVVGEKILVCDIDKDVDEVEYHNWVELCRATANAGDKYTPHTAIILKTPVYKTAYDLFVQIHSLANHFSKNTKDPLGVRAKSLSYQICYGIRRIYDVPEREKALEPIINACEELEFLLQLLKDLREISLDAFALASERIVSISKQLEGLRRKAKAQVCEA